MCVYTCKIKRARSQNLTLTIYIYMQMRIEIISYSIYFHFCNLEILFRIFVFSFIIYFIDIICVDACAFPLFSLWDKMFLIFLPMIFILTFFNIFHKCHLIYRRYLFLFSLNSDQAFRKKAKKVDDFFKSFSFYFYLVGFDWPSLVKC